MSSLQVNNNKVKSKNNKVGRMIKELGMKSVSERKHYKINNVSSVYNLILSAGGTYQA